MRKKWKLSTRLSFVYAIITTVIILSMVAFVYNNYRSRIEWEGERNLIQITRSVMDQVDNNLDSIDNVTIDVLMGNTFLGAMEHWNTEKRTVADQSLLRTRLINSYKNRSNIRRVVIYNLDGDYITTGESSRTQEEVRQRAQSMLSRYNMYQATSRVYLGDEIDYWNSNRQVHVVTEVKPIKNSRAELLGFIEVQQNTYYMQEACNARINGEEIEIIVMMGDPEEMLFANTEEITLSQETIRDYTEHYSRLHRTDGQVVAVAASNTVSCNTIAVIPSKVLLSSAGSLLRGFVLFSVLLVILNILFSRLVTNAFLGPLNSLAHHMEHVDIMNFGEKISIKTDSHEITVLVNTYEEMTRRLHASIEHQKKMEDIQNKALFDALQSTIGPHFLYNSLGGIANMCEEGENEAAADACYSLTEILRYSSNYKETEATAADEIDNIRAYFSIMKGRYRERLHYEVELDPACRYVMLPKLTLQPLVENAIKYSLPEHDMVEVHVRVRKDGQMFRAEVTDNGCGISDDNIRMVKEEMERFTAEEALDYPSRDIQFGGMGLAGTLIRLALFCGSSFYYDLKRGSEGGTSVCFGFRL